MKPSKLLKALSICLILVTLNWGCSPTRMDWDPDDYTVRSGDTLYSIAWRYELDPFELAEWNGLSSPYIIRPGDRLHTKASDSRKTVKKTDRAPHHRARSQTGVVKVEKGDTLYSIAKQNDLSAEQLASINHLKKPYVIHPGQSLQLQARAKTPPSKPTASKTTRSQPKISASTDKNVKLSWQWPIKGKLIGKFNSRKIDAKGIDIAGTEGGPVKAAASGKVVYSGNGLISYGNLIIVKHSRSYLSAYAHNRKLLVKEGQMVTVGQKIAELGKTGADSPRLHFEIRRNGKPVDPLKYLPGS